MMKRLLTIVMLCMMTIMGQAQQKEVTRFLGIPVDGSKQAMINQLKAKGFTYNSEYDYLVGEFNGEDVMIQVQTQGNKVYRIAVLETANREEGQIKIRFNTLISQFKRNGKYLEVEAEELDEKDNISYEMTVHDKQYAAGFMQTTDQIMIPK